MFNDGWKQVFGLTNRTLFEIGTTSVTLASLFRVLLIFVAIWISKLVRHGLNRLAATRRNMDPASLDAFGRFLHYLILFIGLLIGLSSIGLDVTNLTLLAGALGVGIGFGLQGMVNNFVSGIIILFERSSNRAISWNSNRASWDESGRSTSGARASRRTITSTSSFRTRSS